MLGEGELSVSVLNERVPLSQSRCPALAVLRADGLVKTRRESQTITIRCGQGRRSTYPGAARHFCNHRLREGVLDEYNCCVAAFAQH